MQYNTYFLGLSYFFGNRENSTKKLNRFDIEITGYNANVDILLEDCPFEWWQNCGCIMYPNLCQIAKYYISVPAIIHTHIRTLQDQYNFIRNRTMVSGKTVDATIWLHSNR